MGIVVVGRRVRKVVVIVGLACSLGWNCLFVSFSAQIYSLHCCFTSQLLLYLFFSLTNVVSSYQFPKPKGFSMVGEVTIEVPYFYNLWISFLWCFWIQTLIILFLFFLSAFNLNLNQQWNEQITFY